MKEENDLWIDLARGEARATTRAEPGSAEAAWRFENLLIFEKKIRLRNESVNMKCHVEELCKAARNTRRVQAKKQTWRVQVRARETLHT